jgi:hypothetical protein
MSKRTPGIASARSVCRYETRTPPTHPRRMGAHHFAKLGHQEGSSTHTQAVQKGPEAEGRRLISIHKDDHDFWSGVDKHIRGVLRPYPLPFNAEVVEVGGGANTGKVKVRLPGEDFAQADLPWAPVYGATPSVGQYVFTLADFAARRVITSGGGGSSFYQTVAEDGTARTQRATINFGTGFDAVDNSGAARTDVSLDPSEMLVTSTSDGFARAADKAKLDAMPRGLFSAYRATDQLNIADATNVKVQFGTEEYDVDGWFDPTNHRYTPQLAGKYWLNGAVRVLGTAGGARLALMVFKNGAFYRYMSHQHTSGSAQPMNIPGGCQVDANGSTDYFELYIFHSFGASTADIEGGLEATYFQGFYLRAT